MQTINKLLTSLINGEFLHDALQMYVTDIHLQCNMHHDALEDTTASPQRAS